MVLDICIKRWKSGDVRQRNPRIRWWGLKGKEQDVFTNKMIKEGKWDLDEDVEKMWK